VSSTVEPEGVTEGQYDPGPPSLDSATLTVNRASNPRILRPRGWYVTAHPDAGEASIRWDAGYERSTDRGVRGASADPARSARMAARRAQSVLRRYCVSHGLKYLWTLTYRPEDLPDDRDGVWRDIERFRRRISEALGERVPIAAVIEEGSVNNRLHVHFLIGRRVPHSVIETAWGKGWVWVEPPPKNPRAGRRERLRQAAGYLAKYVAKDFVHGHEFNRRRYSTSKGFPPRRTQSISPHLADAYRRAAEFCGALGLSPTAFWSSEDVEDWRGPPLELVWYP
jgi:hypothetical protein